MGRKSQCSDITGAKFLQQKLMSLDAFGDSWESCDRNRISAGF
jgi:hypothetical protein